MNKRIPIKAAKYIAKEYKLDQVVLVAYERDDRRKEHMTHVVTYGRTQADCVQAAQGGNFVKKMLGWPENTLNTEPSRIKKVKEDAQEKLISDIWAVATQDDEMHIFEELLVSAGYRWKCEECCWVGMPDDTKCPCGRPRPSKEKEK
jgi:hypothetical protein